MPRVVTSATRSQMDEWPIPPTHSCTRSIGGWVLNLVIAIVIFGVVLLDEPGRLLDATLFGCLTVDRDWRDEANGREVRPVAADIAGQQPIARNRCMRADVEVRHG